MLLLHTYMFSGRDVRAQPKGWIWVEWNNSRVERLRPWDGTMWIGERPADAVFLPRRPTKSEKPVSGENRSGPIVCAGVNFPHFFNGAPLVDSRRSVGGFRITAVLLCFLVCLSAVSFRSKTGRQMHARQNLSGGWGDFFHCILYFKIVLSIRTSTV